MKIKNLKFILLLLCFPTTLIGQQWRECVRVIDGDTIVFNGNENVRLIGVDTPETKDPRKPIQFFGQEAYGFTKLLVEGKKVRLEYDQDRKDKYGRTLAYVFLEDGTFLNAEIILKGYGFAYTEFPFRYLEEFRLHEKQASTNGVGLWAKKANERIRPNEVDKSNISNIELRYDVEISITADRSIEDEVISYISRELRSLNDVDIVDENAVFIIEIIALEVKSKDGVKAGVAISVLILSPYYGSALKEFLKRRTGTDQDILVDTLTSDLYSKDGHWIEVGGAKDLKSICESIVAEFDAKCLEELRKLDRELDLEN